MSTQGPGLWPPRWWRRIRRTDDDFAAEVRSHLENEAERLVAEGLTPDAARAAAHRQFGNVTRARERFHDARRLVWVEQFARDLRYALRGLRHSRAFVTTTVLTLAVGIAIVTVVFAIFNAYVLRPFAVHDPYSLYSIGWRAQEAAGSSFRWADYRAFTTRTDLFESVVAETTRTISFNSRPLSVGFVSGNYFEALGARVLIGRGLVSDDARIPGAEPVLVLTDQTWARLFDRDKAILGREIAIDGHKVTVVGVMGPEFAGLDQTPRDAWIPLTMYPTIVKDEDPFGASQPRRLRITARLRQDVTPEQAQAALAIEPFATRITGRIDAVRGRLRQQSTPVRMTWSQVSDFSPIIAAFALVLITACANASNVMLARANARHREIGIRLSIGASRGRIVRQLLTEGLLIALLAGFVALALASALLRVGAYAFVAMLPAAAAARARFVPFDLDARVFLFTIAVAGFATVVFALLPALQATRVTLTDALRGQMTGAVRSSTLRNLLITTQVAVSLVLLIVAATLVRNGAAIRATDLGMTIKGVTSVRQYKNSPQLVTRAFEALAADPRVGDVAVTDRNPLFGEMPKAPLRQPTGLVIATQTFVSPNYFAMLGMPILHGRGFTAEEAVQEAPVAVVSAAGASALWPGEDPVGKTLRIHLPQETIPQIADTMTMLRRVDEGTGVVVTVIGVTSDVVSGFVYQGKDSAHLYLPTSATGKRAGAILVRPRAAELPPDALKTILLGADSDAQTFDVMAVDEMVAIQQVPIRAASWLGSFLSAIALALSISGLYGVLSYTFGQRTQEIGIRIALGATTSRVRNLVLRESIRLSVIGALIGLLLGYAVMKALSTVVRLDNVSVVDPGAFVVSVVLIGAAVVLAAVGPSRRAARVDPSSMLRADA
jgi:putative ABC transport system permease protein